MIIAYLIKWNGCYCFGYCFCYPPQLFRLWIALYINTSRHLSTYMNFLYNWCLRCIFKFEYNKSSTAFFRTKIYIIAVSSDIFCSKFNGSNIFICICIYKVLNRWKKGWHINSCLKNFLNDNYLYCLVSNFYGQLRLSNLKSFFKVISTATCLMSLLYE